MKILSSYSDSIIKTTPDVLAERAERGVYPMSDQLINCVVEKFDGNAVILFSGSWRFNFNAMYIEHKGFQLAAKDFHANTLFVDPDNKFLFDYTLQKLKPKTLAILHSGIFFRYRKISDVMIDLNKLKTFIAPQGKIIATIPQNRIDFNRLTTPVSQLAKEISAECVEDSLIITV
jgi:hypothetical protein